MSDQKPQFDPTQPFDVVGGNEKPPFDSSQPFEPVSSFGDKLQTGLKAIDKYSGGASTRAAVNALIEGKGVSGAKDAFLEQLGSNPPPAPTGEDQMVNAGVPADQTRIVRAGPIALPVNAKTLGSIVETLENPVLAAAGAFGKMAQVASESPLLGMVKSFAETPGVQTAAKAIGGLVGFAKGGVEGGYVGYKAVPEAISKGTSAVEKVLNATGKVSSSPLLQDTSAAANFLRTPTGQAVMRRLQQNSSQ